MPMVGLPNRNRLGVLLTLPITKHAFKLFEIRANCSGLDLHKW